MKKADVRRAAAFPEDIDPLLTESLKKAVEKFPYSTALQMLLTKGYQNQDSYLFPQALRRSAALSRDRRALFAWIENSFERPAQDIEPTSVEEILASVRVEEPTQTIELAPVKTIPVAEVIENPANHPAGDLSHLPERVRAIIERSRRIREGMHPTTTETPTAGAPVLASPAPIASAPESPPAPVREVAPQRIPEPISEPIANPTPESMESSDAAASSFAQWLQQNTRKEEKENPFSTQELIDAFLEKSPRKAPSTPASPHEIRPETVDYIQHLVGGDELFMTETLAKVYLAQGAYTKAAQAYEILRLKYPEKSATFAALILEIRQLQRKQKP